MMIAARDEATCCSPAAIRGNGIAISTMPKTISQVQRPRRVCSSPRRQAKATSTIAASTTRTQARKAGETPSSTATLMNR